VCTNPTAGPGDVLVVNVFADTEPNSYGGSPINVNTTLSVTITIEGDIQGPVGGSIQINSGQSSATGNAELIDGENVVSISIDNIQQLPPITSQVFVASGTKFTGNC
jgi:hypothetical protein